jgi:vacuolar protein sorting-associated protein 13A/C
LNIGISSKKRLELNLTASFIEIALTTSTLLDRDGGQLFRKPRGSNAPFLLKNRTGYALGFAKTPAKSHQYGKDSATNRDEGGSKMVVVADGKDLPWRFDDWRTMREVSTSLSLPLDRSFSSQVSLNLPP